MSNSLSGSITYHPLHGSAILFIVSMFWYEAVCRYCRTACWLRSTQKVGSSSSLLCLWNACDCSIAWSSSATIRLHWQQNHCSYDHLLPTYMMNSLPWRLEASAQPPPGYPHSPQTDLVSSVCFAFYFLWFSPRLIDFQQDAMWSLWRLPCL